MGLAKNNRYVEWQIFKLIRTYWNVQKGKYLEEHVFRCAASTTNYTDYLGTAHHISPERSGGILLYQIPPLHLTCNFQDFPLPSRATSI